MEPSAESRGWQRHIQRTRSRINAGWMADRLAPIWIATGILSCCLLLFVRTLPDGNPPPLLLLGGITLLLLVAGSILAWFQARRRFITTDEARVRLEACQPLHGSLSSANRGFRNWPELPLASGEPIHRLRWNWLRLSLPFILALLLIVFPLLLPPPTTSTPSLAPNEPLAWESMDDLLDQLEEEEIVHDDDLDDFASQLEELRQTPPEEWFQHSSLEATDSLQESLLQSMRQLESHLSKASQSMSLLDQQDTSLTESDRNALQSQFSESLQGLRSPDLALNPSLLEQLQDYDPMAAPSGSEATKALRDALRQNAQALRELMEQSQALSQSWQEDLDSRLSQQGGPGSNPQTALGTPQRGPGEAPMFYQDQPTDLATDSLKDISNPDQKHAAPGDLLGLTPSAPSTVEEEPGRVQEGGGIQGRAQGGDQVWESNLLPAERDVLKDFFR